MEGCYLRVWGFKYLVGYGKCVRYVTSEEGEYVEGFFFFALCED